MLLARVNVNTKKYTLLQKLRSAPLQQLASVPTPRAPFSDTPAANCV